MTLKTVPRIRLAEIARTKFKNAYLTECEAIAMAQELMDLRQKHDILERAFWAAENEMRQFMIETGHAIKITPRELH
jgi:GTP-binding protein EngB required for normal cell division